MTGAYQCLGFRAAIGSRLGPLLWLLTALSILQWPPAAVDPYRLVHLLAEPGSHASLSLTDHSSYPVVEVRSASTTTVADKRSPAGRSVPVGDGGDTAALGSIHLPSGKIAALRVVAVAQRPLQAAGHWAFTARSPPPAG